MLAHEKGEGLEKDAESDYGPSLEVVYSMFVYISLEGIGLIAALTAVQAGEVMVAGNLPWGRAIRDFDGQRAVCCQASRGACIFVFPE